MKFCSHCGAQIMDQAIVCPKCGCSVASISANTPKADDAPSTGFAVLGFLIPLIGLILYLVWKNDYPLRAHSAGKGALSGFIFSIAAYIIMIAATSCAAIAML